MKRPFQCAVLVLVCASAALLVKSPAPKLVPPQSEAGLLARVGERVITEEDFKRELSRRHTPMASADKEAILNELISAEAAYVNACKEGLDRDPEVLEELHQLVINKYRARELERLQPAEPTEADIQERYRRDASRFTQPEKKRVAILVLKIPGKATEEKRAEAEQRAAALLEQARKLPSNVTTFGVLAANKSEDETSRYLGGDCGWVLRGQPFYRWDGKVTEAIFGLKERGEFAGPLIVENEIYLLRLIDSAPPETKPLAAAHEQLTFEMRRERQELQRRAFAAKQREGLTISIDRERLDSIPIPESLRAQDLAANPPRSPVR
jgi:hypothetical protein